jgi:hypothetical protein
VFIRTKAKPDGRTYSQLVESYRTPKGPRQRVLLHLGPNETVEDALKAEKARLANYYENSMRAKSLQKAKEDLEVEEAKVKILYKEQIERFHGGVVPTYQEAFHRSSLEEDYHEGFGPGLEHFLFKLRDLVPFHKRVERRQRRFEERLKEIEEKIRKLEEVVATAKEV